MPNKLSTWIDICVTLIVSLILLVILFQYNWYIFSGGIVLWICLFFYLKERSIERRKNLKAYYENVIKNVNELSNYALEQLPQVIMVINKDLRLEWYNHELERWLKQPPEIGSFITDIWPNIPIDNIWNRNGQYIFSQDNKFYMVIYRPVNTDDDSHLMTLYIYDISEYERFKLDTAISVPSSNALLLLVSIYTLVTLLRFLPVRVMVVPCDTPPSMPVVFSLNQYDLRL